MKRPNNSSWGVNIELNNTVEDPSSSRGYFFPYALPISCVFWVKQGLFIVVLGQAWFFRMASKTLRINLFFSKFRKNFFCFCTYRRSNYARQNSIARGQSNLKNSWRFSERLFAVLNQQLEFLNYHLIKGCRFLTDLLVQLNRKKGACMLSTL